ncbi:MAG TPA: DoxX family membrane protein [Candidatus Limnocylindrales bacterium]|nr:DoxX family membrane protein [Candidatus Limnocylindrales bacterium]
MSSLRNAALAVGGLAVVLLLWMVNPWVDVPAGLERIVAVAFWILSIALVAILYVDARRNPQADDVEIEGPAFARFLFNNSRAGLFWLPIRLFIGFEWLEAGWHKVSGPGWLDGGAALAGFWKGAAAVPAGGRPPITYEWYRDFITFLLNGHHQTWFAPLVAFGELAIGLGLIFGALTGVAAFFGAFMNMSFLLAGSASTNPIMFTAAIGLILAWKVAGYYGVDRYLLPRLGTPWRPGTVLGRPRQQAPLRT